MVRAGDAHGKVLVRGRFAMRCEEGM